MKQKQATAGVPANVAGGAGQETRRVHLQIMLDHLTAHADVVRYHLRGRPHNPTLGFAAEAGLRDVLRQVLPKNLAVTSGFIRKATGELILPSRQREDVSPQTDVIIYDATRSCPLYSIEGVDVVAAPDVLGVFEIKDSENNEGDLYSAPPGESEELPDDYSAMSENEVEPPERADRTGGSEDESTSNEIAHALPHIAALADAAPQAFRAIVLVQGGIRKSALARFRHFRPSAAGAPHAIFCRALDPTKKKVRESYLAFQDYLAGEMCFHFYNGTDGPRHSLAGFLRLVTGFFAVQGLTSAAIATDLRPPVPQTLEKIPLGSAGKILSLQEAVLAAPQSATSKQTPPFEEQLKHFVNPKVKQGLQIWTFPGTGHDREGLPTSGLIARMRWKDSSYREFASFFTPLPNGNLVCSDRDRVASGPTLWVIRRESVEAHLKRVCEINSEHFVDELPPEAAEAPAEPDAPRPRDAPDDGHDGDGSGESSVHRDQGVNVMNGE